MAFPDETIFFQVSNLVTFCREWDHSFAWVIAAPFFDGNMTGSFFGGDLFVYRHSDNFISSGIETWYFSILTFPGPVREQ